MKKFIILTLLFAITVSILGGTKDVSTTRKFAIYSYDQYQESSGYKNLIYSDMDYYYPESLGNITIDRVKILNDMNGNYYNLVEFLPTGYSIYDYDYSSLLKIGYSATSPYLHEGEGLIYLGAFNYYTYDAQTRSMLPYLRHCSDSSFDLLLTKENISNISKSVLKINNNIQHSNAQRLASQTRGSTQEFAILHEQSVIIDADTTGFNNNNNCGYVGAALIIFYAAQSWDWDYLFSGTIITNTLVMDIQQDKPGPSWAPDVEDSLNDYMISKGCTSSFRVNMWHIPAAHTVYDRVKEDKPVLLFSSLPDGDESINHVVTVHKVERTATFHLFGIKTYSNYMYTVHYGWDLDDGLNNVTISHSAIMIGGLINLHK